MENESKKESENDEIHAIVLLSSYNGSKYIYEQIKSILDQDFSGIITILVRDDGSSDDTVGIVCSIKCPDNRKIELLNESDADNNLGPQRSFLKLIELAPPANYYFLSDQDDVWRPDHISCAVGMLKEYRTPALYCSNYSLSDAELNIVKDRVIESEPQFTPLKVFFYNQVPGCCMAWNNMLQNYLRQMYPENIMMHDRYIASFASFVGKVIYDPHSHILHRIHGDNVIGVGHKKIKLTSWLKEKSDLLKTRENYDVCKMAEEFLRVGRIICHDGYEHDVQLLANFRKSPQLTLRLLCHPDTKGNIYDRTVMSIRFKIFFRLF